MDPYDFKIASLKSQITQARQNLNQAWAVNEITDALVLALGERLDELCNEYERLKKLKKE